MFSAHKLDRYSVYRVADDLVDEAKTPEEARQWISKLSKYLDAQYGEKPESRSQALQDFPPEARLALDSLPADLLSRRPFDDLLKGFETDARFLASAFPIADQAALETYAARVAGTVAESCIELCFHHGASSALSTVQKAKILAAGRTMGKALQLVNIARDIRVDATSLRRVYIPGTWLQDVGLTPHDVLADPDRTEVGALRQRLLDRAFALYDEARPQIERLPANARGPMRVAVDPIPLAS